MLLKPLSALVASLACSYAMADACQVSTRSASERIPSPENESCYEYRNMPAGSIDWSCSNESKDMLDTEKRKVQRCDSGHFGQCSARLTQASLADHSAGSDRASSGIGQVPENARLITYYYSVADKAQTRLDCENGGGTWQDSP
ncbi:hypothetical protein [Phytopseudomonas dryadis]|uniref:Uncharacterized protein n=1 Tax=Phytopseudomonas dryadis TaxID=2487520 RepID=A0ABY1Z2U1_9GAMM|nr:MULTISPECIES: hypothetical protein [Pseudomonas]TBV01511.1 hypothetical protein DNK34_20950 [Pseudomonas dryadis]TBV19416.1 hypothetical protein DNK41_02455 [Pseudomonas sp. FRB 230]